MSPETIYQSLYVQSRGALKQELTRHLRTGRALRSPSRKTGQRKNRIPNMINISERPAQASDRAVPGSWEGDLIIGKGNLPRDRHARGTLQQLHDAGAPSRRIQAEQVASALTAKIQPLPDRLRVALTWDQGPRCGTGRVRIDTGIEIFFCDPKSPWQRGINENTNGLLRQYFPKGTELAVLPRGTPRRRRCGTERPAPQTTRVPNPDRSHRERPVAMTARIRRSSYGREL